MRKIKCLRCGLKWIPRVENPVSCPACHSRKYKKRGKCKKKKEEKK